jgi:hypothetical protein
MDGRGNQQGTGVLVLCLPARRRMLDWVYLARKALWILGMSIVLATWSYARTRASEQRLTTRAALSRWPCGAALAAGMVLFCAGLAWGAAQLWERLLWCVVALAFTWQIYRLRVEGGES